MATIPALSALGNFDHAFTTADRSGSVGAGVSQGGLAAFSEVKSLKNAPLFALPKCGMFIFPEDLNRGSNPLGVTFSSLLQESFDDLARSLYSPLFAGLIV